MRTISYNSQRNNFDFSGAFHGWQQCFSTSAWMLLSFFCPKMYRSDDDQGLATYVDDVCNTVGKIGVGEAISKKLHISGNTAYWWAVHQEAIREWIFKAGKKIDVIFEDGTASWNDFADAIKKSPVILGTNKLAGLPGGHIILVVDYDGKNLYVNDPYGDATTGYKDPNGTMRIYPKEWIKPYVGGDHLRIMWVEE